MAIGMPPGMTPADYTMLEIDSTGDTRTETWLAIRRVANGAIFLESSENGAAGWPSVRFMIPWSQVAALAVALDWAGSPEQFARHHSHARQVDAALHPGDNSA